MIPKKISSLTQVAAQMGKKGGKAGKGSGKKEEILVTIVICNESQLLPGCKKQPRIKNSFSVNPVCFGHYKLPLSTIPG